MKTPDTSLSNAKRPARLLIGFAGDGTLKTVPATIHMGSQYSSGYSPEHPNSSAGTLVVDWDAVRASPTKVQI